MILSPRARWIAAAFLTAGALFFWLERRTLVSSRFPQARSFQVLDTVVRHVRNDYLEEVDPGRAMEGAYQGLIGALDALSSYLDKSAVAKFTSPKKLALNDVGAIVYKKTGIFPVVVGVVEGSPAEKAGIKVGDYLSALEGRSMIVWSLNEVRWFLKDETKTPVKMRLIRENDTLEKAVERGPLSARPLDWTAQKESSGIVRIRHFHPGLTEAFKAEILPRIREAKSPLVLDLRECFEGEIEEARTFINLFLKADAAGHFEKKGGAKEALVCPAEPALPDIPLVVWVSPATMGPAELAAGVLRELRKAKVVGNPTFGLVARQELFRLEGGDALLLSTGAFALPSGEKLLGKGVTVDVKVESEGRETKAYLEKSFGPGSGR
jgi:C-terminal peptidase prc